MSEQTEMRICACTLEQLSCPVAVVSVGNRLVVFVREDLPVEDVLADAALVLSPSEQAVLLSWLEARW